jgi:hypothetical protein
MTTDLVDIYPVGVMATLIRVRRLIFGRSANYGTVGYGWRLGEAARLLRIEVKTLWRLLREPAADLELYCKSTRWRLIKTHFFGFIAEPYDMLAWSAYSDGPFTCGTGWTKNRAMRSLRANGWRG